MAARRLRALHEKKPFDVIHAHGDVHEIAGLLSTARRVGVPLVLTVHSGLRQTALYKCLARRLFSRLHAVVAVSAGVADDVRSLGVDERRIVVQSSGIDSTTFAPSGPSGRAEARKALGIPESEFVVATVSRLDPVKGHSYLVEAAVDVAKRLPGFRLLIAGDGSLRTQLGAMAKGCTRVQFLGQLSPSDVGVILRAADCFALASVDLPGLREGTPTALLEAMSCGLPAVVTDSGGMGNAVEGWPGITPVPQRDKAALIAAFLELAANPQARESLAVANRRRASGLDWSVVAIAVTGAYSRRS